MTKHSEKPWIVRSLAVPLWALATLGFVLAESGCSEFNTKHIRIGEAAGLATRADIRVITERPDPYPVKDEKHPTVVCAEPSPDVALALSRALTAEAHAKTKAGVEAGASGGYQTNEAALALAGRTSAVVALRDGLFRACEGYANGIIGRDSYALILSQYGDLLVTLILGDSAATNVGGVSSVTTEKIALPAGKPTAAGDATPVVKDAKPAPAATPSAADPAVPATKASARLSGPDAAHHGLFWLASAPAPAKKPVTVKPKARAAVPTAPKATAADEKPVVATTTASAAEGIAKAYFAGEKARLIKAMFVVCTAEAERRHTAGIPFPQTPKGAGDYFDRMCDIDLDVLMTLPAAVKVVMP